MQKKKFQIIEEGMTRDTMKKLMGGCGKQYCDPNHCTHTTERCGLKHSCSDYACCPVGTPGSKNTCSDPYTWCSPLRVTDLTALTQSTSVSTTNLAIRI